MLVIRDEQMDALRDEALRRYTRVLLEKMLQLRDIYPTDFPQVPTDRLKALVSDFVDEARQLTLHSERDIAGFVYLRLLCADYYLIHAVRFCQGISQCADPQDRSDYILSFLKEAAAAEQRRNV